MSYAKKMLIAVLAAGIIGGPISSIVAPNNKSFVGVVVGVLAYALLTALGNRREGTTSSAEEGGGLTDEGKQALAQLNEALNKTPNDCASLLARADFFRIIGDHRHAMADCDQALGLEPANCEARSLRGTVFASQGNHRAAIDEYSKALEANRQNSKYFFNRGLAYFHLRRHDEAIADYLRAIELDPTDPSAYNNLGLAYAEKRRMNDAIAAYSRSIALDPRKASAYDNRGYAYMQAGDPLRACRDWYSAHKFGMSQNWNLALSNRDVPIAPELITEEYNLDPPVQAVSPEESLVRAAVNGDNETVLKLLQKGANPNAVPRGITALHAAVEREFSGITVALIENGARTDVQCKANSQLKGRTPLVLAVRARCSDEMISLLVKRSANINTPDGSGLTPLGAALMPIRTQGLFPGLWDCPCDLVKFLVQLGADPNQPFDFEDEELFKEKDPGKVIPLIVTAGMQGHKGAMAVAQVLIDGGADINAVSANGKTAVQAAEQVGNSGLAKMLRKASAKPTG